ncbi:pilus assembly protein [Tardiphaga sp.]|uniref:TadE/TadG family type IV pilus assembly protein n=1 Tax=Tardiphaga sp. TaxID=1926292 RepID=UPI0025D970BF|nr:pilus assembly protein [Tardiphaga sp.]
MSIPSINGTTVRLFRRNRKGSAAVEFALIAPVFFALIFAIIETGMVFFAGQVLETGVQNGARQFYTSQTVTQTSLNADLCSSVNTLMDCSPTKLCLDVRTFAAGAAVVLPSVVDSSGTYSCVVQLPSAGDVSSTVVVRAFYQWPLFVTGLGYNIADVQRGTINSKRLLAAATAIRPQ